MFKSLTKFSNSLTNWQVLHSYPYHCRNGRLLGVCASVDNCRLFVGGIPKSKKREEILSEMRKVTEGVVDVIVYPSAADKTKNRGFAFVEYESHRAAAMARRKLLPGKHSISFRGFLTVGVFEENLPSDISSAEKFCMKNDIQTKWHSVKTIYINSWLLTSFHQSTHNPLFPRTKTSSWLNIVFQKKSESGVLRWCCNVMNACRCAAGFTSVISEQPKNQYYPLKCQTHKIKDNIIKKIQSLFWTDQDYVISSQSQAVSISQWPIEELWRM